MRVRLVRIGPLGLVLRRVRGRGGVTVTYGEILTVERLVGVWGLRLHTRTGMSVRIPCRGATRVAIESELRRRGVRIVDHVGAMITPTLEDFEAELARVPDRMRQSSDDA